jgi:hypothetical protein
MEHIFRYQPHLRFTGSDIATGCAILIAAAWSVPLMVHGAPGMLYPAIIGIATYVSFTVVIAGILASVITAMLRQTAWVITETRLARATPKNARACSFSRVSAYRWRRLPPLKGYGVVQTDSATIRLPFVIENLAQCAELIRDRLIATGNLAAFDSRRISRFIRAAAVSDASARRMRRALWPLIGMSYGLMVFNGMTAVRLWGMPAALSAAWMICGPVFPALGFLGADRALCARMHAALKAHPDRDATPDAPKAYAIAGVTTAAAYLLSGIALQRWYVWFIGY